MKKITMISALALALAAGAAAAARSQDAKAEEILARTRKVIGGKKLQELKGLSLQAAMQRNLGNMQIASDVEIHIETPDKYVRTELSRRGMGMEIRSGFNGDRAILPAGAGMSMAGGGMFVRMGPGGPIPGAEGPKPPPEQLEEMNRTMLRSQRVEISRLMLGWLSMTHPSLKAQYTYAGEAESPDGKAHVIDVKDDEGFAARLFVDQNNYLPLMVSYEGRQPRMITSTGPAPGGAPRERTDSRDLSEDERKKLQQEVEDRTRREVESQPLVEFSVFFDDWREVDGIHFPHLMRRGAEGTTTEEWTISKVKVNPKIDAKKFAVETK